MEWVNLDSTFAKLVIELAFNPISLFAAGRVRYYDVKHNLTWVRIKYGYFNLYSKTALTILEYKLK